jgi:hypothetical protein
MNEHAGWTTRLSSASILLTGTLLACGGRTIGLSGEGGPDGSADGLSGFDAPHMSDVAMNLDAGHQTASKVDLLFDIDNSASMGDKQAYLEKAVPDLVNHLVNPNCIQSDGKTIAGPSTNASCAAYPGTTIEFPPVHDMHIGIISSSLGSRGVTGGGEVCDPAQMTNGGMPFLDGTPALPSHTDDRGHLLNRIPGAAVTSPPSTLDQETEATSTDEGGQDFLDWFPKVPPNTGKTATGGEPQDLAPVATRLTSNAVLESDFEALVIGVHAYGCGIESQLESWYRFLIQPDPYDSIAIGSDGLAQWSGVDATIIQQRHDFLRPDSLVAIIDMTDENDSEIDVRSFGGQGYKFMDQTFQPPQGTSECEANPSSAECTSCAYSAASSDPNCMMGPYMAETDWGFYINVRHVHMQQKYGIVPQFPLGRYVLGLTSPMVPDRSTEYPAGANCYQGGVGNPSCTDATTLNTADLNCTNPLFAATLPDGSDMTEAALCNTAGAGGPRGAGLVFYAHIGGVPHELLQAVPGDSTGLCPMGTDPADCPQKNTLLSSDWVSILGMGWASIPSPAALTNPNQYDYTGIDPHMLESYTPRPGLPSLTTGPNPTGGGPDAINGGDWVTNTTQPAHVLPVDREFACIFQLPAPRDCSNLEDFVNQEACDCSVPGLPVRAVPSVCGLENPAQPYAADTNDYTTQYYAKAYPTIRELELAELLGTQGVISSLCPIHVVDSAAGDDPLFGYRPAMTTLVARMKPALSNP